MSRGIYIILYEESPTLKGDIMFIIGTVILVSLVVISFAFSIAMSWGQYDEIIIIDDPRPYGEHFKEKA